MLVVTAGITALVDHGTVCMGLEPGRQEVAIQGGGEKDNQHPTKGGCWNIARCWSELGRAIELGVYPTAESEASWTV